MKQDHKLFFAIPFDTATKELYSRVCEKIKKQYPHVTTIIGNQEIGPSRKYSDIASFKAQNRELNRQFKAQIQDADIVIADLTHNNPNVHVELGIALIQNKNILRVTGRSLSELGFDIQNLEVHQYKIEAQLIETIINYLEMFLKIKKLPIKNEFPDLYFKEPNTLELRALQTRDTFDFKSSCPPTFTMRDGAVRVRYKIINTQDQTDWFGIYFRADGFHPAILSHLVYMRKSGDIEIATYRGPYGPLAIECLGKVQAVSDEQELTIQFENNYLEVQTGNDKFKYEKLSIQTIGRVWPAAFRANVDVYLFEMVCRDTIEWDFPA